MFHFSIFSHTRKSFMGYKTDRFASNTHFCHVPQHQQAQRQSNKSRKAQEFAKMLKETPLPSHNSYPKGKDLSNTLEAGDATTILATILLVKALKE
jgi:hypothetical protein